MAVLLLFVLATEATIEILKEWVIVNDSVTLILRIYESTDRRKYNYLKSYKYIMEFKRVQYEMSPLAEVIFQVRFPNILRIASEEPSAFQEIIRKDYPLLSVNNNETVVEVNGQKQSVGTTKNYQFVSVDGRSKVNLTNSFIAYSTLKYLKWELFKKECEKVVQTFKDIYQPSIIQRVGLRYKDVIMRSRWGLQDTPWKELIHDKYLGILAEGDERKVRRYVLDYEHEVDAPVMAHRHFEIVRTAQNPNELSLMIDCDYSVNMIMPYDDIAEKSEKLHDCSSLFLRTAITEKLHLAMKPKDLV